MFIKNQKEVYQKALKLWGNAAQVDKAVEEFAELISAIFHYRNAKVSLKHYIAELCDVVIMTRQLSLIVDETIEYEFHFEELTPKDFEVENIRKKESNIVTSIGFQILFSHQFENENLKFDLEFKLGQLDFLLCELGILLDRHLFDKTLRNSIEKLNTKIDTHYDKQVLANA